MMKKYEVELTMLFKKKLNVMAEDREDAAAYAEELFFRTNALNFDKDDVLDITTRVQSADTGYLSKYLGELDEDDDYGCSDFDLDAFEDEDGELPFNGSQVDDEDDEDGDEDADEEYADHLLHVLLDAFDTSKEALQEMVEIADELKKVTGENIYLALLR